MTHALLEEMPGVVAFRMFDWLDGYSLGRLSLTSTKWRAWIVSYAPSRLRGEYPHLYRDGIAGTRALAILFGQALICKNLALGRFRHIAIPLPSFSFGSSPEIRGTDGGIIVAAHSPHGAGHHLISSRTGAIKQLLLGTLEQPDGHLFVETMENNLILRPIGNQLHGWDHVTGALKHQIAYPGNFIGLNFHGDNEKILVTVLGNSDGPYDLAIIDLTANRTRLLEPPEPHFMPVSNGFGRHDFCIRDGSSLSVIWHRNEQHRLAHYSLQSQEEPLRPTHVTPWAKSVAYKLYNRYECGDLQLVALRIDNANTTHRWFILDGRGEPVCDKEIIQLVSLDELVILLVKEEDDYSFQAFDVAKREVIWSCLIKQPLQFNYIDNVIMKAAKPDRLFLFCNGTYLLLDLPSQSIVKQAKLPTIGYPHFDGEKIILKAAGKILHIYDFSYESEAPYKVLESSLSPNFCRAVAPQLGQSYQLEGHRNSRGLLGIAGVVASVLLAILLLQSDEQLDL